MSRKWLDFEGGAISKFVADNLEEAAFLAAAVALELGIRIGSRLAARPSRGNTSACGSYAPHPPPAEAVLRAEALGAGPRLQQRAVHEKF